MASTTKNSKRNTKRIKYGDRVAVPWGLCEIVGVVQEVYGPSIRRHAVVRVPTRGPLGEILDEQNMSFPLDTLRLVETS